MAVSNSVYKVYRMAAKKRIEDGEDPYEVVASLTKLSADQKERLTEELIEMGVME